MRTFIAIEFDRKTRDVLYGYGRNIRNMTKSGNFSYNENIHLTVKFIGDVKESDTGILKRLMDQAINGLTPFDIHFNGLGTFSTGKDNILWIGVKMSPSLGTLYKNINALLFAKGFKGDNKPFKPHITLGRRVIFDTSVHDIKQKIELNVDPVKVTGLTLFESVRIRGRLTYIPIYKAELKGTYTI